MLKRFTLSSFMFLFLLASCGKGPAVVSQKSSSTQEVYRSSCNVVSGTADPRTIEQLVVLINSLPKPLDISCLIKTLKRPLYVNATSSTMSVQPANGVTNPRIFIVKGNLIMSVVPSGEGSKILEFSELTSSLRSFKGEVNLPILKTLSMNDVFSTTMTSNQTSCSGCHFSERKEVISGREVFTSAALRPSPSKDVALDKLQYEHYLCNFNKDSSSRCALYKAIFSHGEVESYQFDSSMPLFLSNF